MSRYRIKFFSDSFDINPYVVILREMGIHFQSVQSVIGTAVAFLDEYQLKSVEKLGYVKEIKKLN